MTDDLRDAARAAAVETGAIGQEAAEQVADAIIFALARRLNPDKAPAVEGQVSEGRDTALTQLRAELHRARTAAVTAMEPSEVLRQADRLAKLANQAVAHARAERVDWREQVAVERDEALKMHGAALDLAVAERDRYATAIDSLAQLIDHYEIDLSRSFMDRADAIIKDARG